MNKSILLSLMVSATLLFAACGNNQSGNKPANDSKPAATATNTADLAKYKAYAALFKPMDLPISLHACQIDPKTLLAITEQNYPAYVHGTEYVYGSFKTNGDYTAYITLGQADCALPSITTIDKNGNVIDHREIGIGGCGADCGFQCSEFFVLNADYTLYTSDTITYAECDDKGKSKTKTKEHYVNYKTGKLNNTGKIDLTKEIKKPL